MAIEIPDMVRVGSTDRNNSKTTLTEALIKQCQEIYPVYDLKITTTSGRRGVCQQGTKGYGICTSITTGYGPVEEQETTDNKSTMKLLATGCQKVFLLKVFQENLAEIIQ